MTGLSQRASRRVRAGLLAAPVAAALAAAGAGPAGATAIHASRVQVTSGGYAATGHPVKVWADGGWRVVAPGDSRTTDEVTADFPFWVDTPGVASSVCYQAGAHAWPRGDSFAWTVTGCGPRR